jgi:peptidoglycan hydrolase-like amidase
MIMTLSVVWPRAAEAIAVHSPRNPEMRVLLGDAASPNILTANGKYVVETDTGEQVLVVKRHKWVKLRYDSATEKYILRRGDRRIESDRPLRVTPVKAYKTVEVITFENRPAWNTELNDNRFFGSVEVVYSTPSGKPLLVNEIGIERYIRGIAEVSNTSPEAYLKALLTAARTYALYNITHPTKHAPEPYILSATDGDQIYRGANFSKRSPNVVAAQKATRRQVVLYDGEPIIAAYFSRSDGRTRSWSEVWGGSYPWAVSVDDPCCDGETLWGHGVGLSGTGARYFADLGWGWKKILTYYYTGVTIGDGY